MSFGSASFGSASFDSASFDSKIPFDADCLFCKMIVGEIPVELVAESEWAIVIRDINPTAPMHLLAIPKRHCATVRELADADTSLVGELVLLADQAAKKQGNEDYRLIFNTGSGAGQSIFHVHGHVIGGKQLDWNPA